MEVIFTILVIFVIYSLISEKISENLKKKNKEKKINTPNFPINSKENKLVDTEIVEDFQRESKTTINNYYTQNVYLQKNIYTKDNDKENHGDHSEKVWNRMGYRVKYGETYSYKHYGNYIFTPKQVEKIGHSNTPLLLESNLTKNQKKVKQLGYSLVNKYGSKRKAKDILVEEYGFDEATAKYASGYRGYENF